MSESIFQHLYFSFTQSNLQDYLTCQRRFELRYLRQMNWPAVETAPIHEAERRMQVGSTFHRLIHQYLLGLSQGELTATAEQTATLIESPELAQMWHNFLARHPTELAQPAARFYPEITLSTLVAGHRLTAKYDLLVLLPGDPPHITIFDWKTSSKRPDSTTLQNQAQSRVYPFVLSEAGYTLNDNNPLQPNEITMSYWFANAPRQPEIITYHQAQYEADQRWLQDLIQEITTAPNFPLTDDHAVCRYCVYRSYCDRGQEAGLLDDIDDDLELDAADLDWEQISEIAY